MKDFDWIYHRALELKGSELDYFLPDVKTVGQLLEKDSSQYLSLISQRIFRAGLRHSVVDAKWPIFETVFKGFNPIYVANLSDEALEAHMLQPGLIKHWGKMKALRHNAAWLLQLEREYEHGFASMIADWPATDITGLWLFMKKQGLQLGGRSASAVLRMAGKDTFMLTQDVMVQLRALGVVDTIESTTAQRDLRAIQQAFNVWYDQSGVPMAHISRLLSFT